MIDGFVIRNSARTNPSNPFVELGPEFKKVIYKWSFNWIKTDKLKVESYWFASNFDRLATIFVASCPLQALSNLTAWRCLVMSGLGRILLLRYAFHIWVFFMWIMQIKSSSLFLLYWRATEPLLQNLVQGGRSRMESFLRTRLRSVWSCDSCSIAVTSSTISVYQEC